MNSVPILLFLATLFLINQILRTVLFTLNTLEINITVLVTDAHRQINAYFSLGIIKLSVRLISIQFVSATLFGRIDIISIYSIALNADSVIDLFAMRKFREGTTFLNSDLKVGVPIKSDLHTNSV